MEDATSSRLNDQLRVHIQDLKRELEEERNKVKNVKHEKVKYCYIRSFICSSYIYIYIYIYKHKVIINLLHTR